jgi:DNA gyrase/topoisomerase IV subunit B
VVNALSEWLKLRIWRDGKAHYLEFHHGDLVKPLEVTGDTDKRGTEVHFLAATETFGTSSSTTTSSPSACASSRSSTTAARSS